MQVIIVAGGKGERLRPLTNKKPKPMIDIAGKPVVEHIIEFFNKSGIEDFIFSLCYLSDVISSYFGDGSRFGVKIKYIFEDEKQPLGTAGSILSARKFIDDTFIVTYADMLRELDIQEVINTHKKNGAMTTIVVYQNKKPFPKSSVCFNEKGEVNSFKERPEYEEITSKEVWSNASFYIFQPEIFDFIPKDKPSDFGYDIFPKLIASGKKMIAYKQKGFLLDIGNMKKLNEAESYFSHKSG